MRLFKFVSLLSLALAVPLIGRADAQEPAPVRKLTVAGEVKYKPYTLVRLKAEGVDPKAGIIWRVYPNANVQRATTPKGVLEFVAPPGVYQVECLVITTTPDGSIGVDEQSVGIEIEGCCDKVPPITPPAPLPKQPDPPGSKKPDAINALGRIQFGSAGCTATIIGPRRADGRWDVLTAAHCVTGVGVGAKGSLKLKDGRTLSVRVVNIHEDPDCSWLVTDDASLADLAFATIAEKNPLPGTNIWHRGYGIDRPDNREDGTVTVGQDGNGQIEMNISVSSGDSGGGIFRNDNDELISVVCCTTAKGAKARVWGCSAEVARRLRPVTQSEEVESWWTPIEIPPREVTNSAKWTPIELPVREVKGPVAIWLKEPFKGR